LDWQEEKHVPVSCLDDVAVAFLLSSHLAVQDLVTLPVD